MTKTLKRAFSEVSRLEKDAQEHIGRELLAHVQKFQRLREDVQKGMRSINAGRIVAVDIESVIRRARRRHAKAGKGAQ